MATLVAKTATRADVTASPRGTLILCEDNINDNFVRGRTDTLQAALKEPGVSAAAGAGDVMPTHILESPL